MAFQLTATVACQSSQRRGAIGNGSAQEARAVASNRPSFFMPISATRIRCIRVCLKFLAIGIPREVAHSVAAAAAAGFVGIAAGAWSDGSTSAARCRHRLMGSGLTVQRGPQSSAARAVAAMPAVRAAAASRTLKPFDVIDWLIILDLLLPIIPGAWPMTGSAAFTRGPLGRIKSELKRFPFTIDNQLAILVLSS
jgi:hypothetical protein